MPHARTLRNSSNGTLETVTDTYLPVIDKVCQKNVLKILLEHKSETEIARKRYFDMGVGKIPKARKEEYEPDDLEEFGEEISAK